MINQRQTCVISKVYISKDLQKLSRSVYVGHSFIKKLFMNKLNFILFLIYVLLGTWAVFPQNSSSDCLKLVGKFIIPNTNHSFTDKQIKILGQILKSKGKSLSEEKVFQETRDAIVTLSLEKGISPKKMIQLILEIDTTRFHHNYSAGYFQLMDFLEESLDIFQKTKFKKLAKKINNNDLWMSLNKEYQKKGPTFFQEIFTKVGDENSVFDVLNSWLKNQKKNLAHHLNLNSEKKITFVTAAQDYEKALKENISTYIVMPVQDAKNKMLSNIKDASINLKIMDKKNDANEIITKFDNFITALNDKEFKKLLKDSRGKTLRELVEKEYDRMTAINPVRHSLINAMKASIDDYAFELGPELKKSIEEFMPEMISKAKKKCGTSKRCLKKYAKTIEKLYIQKNKQKFFGKVKKFMPCVSKNPIIMRDAFFGFSAFIAQLLFAYREKSLNEFPYELVINGLVMMPISMEFGCRAVFKNRLKFGKEIKIRPPTLKETSKFFFLERWAPLFGLVSTSTLMFQVYRAGTDRLLDREKKMAWSDIGYNLPIYVLYSSAWGPMKSMLVIDRLKYVAIPAISNMITTGITKQWIKTAAAFALLQGVDKGFIARINMMEWKWFDSTFAKKIRVKGKMTMKHLDDEVVEYIIDNKKDIFLAFLKKHQTDDKITAFLKDGYSQIIDNIKTYDKSKNTGDKENLGIAIKKKYDFLLKIKSFIEKNRKIFFTHFGKADKRDPSSFDQFEYYEIAEGVGIKIIPVYDGERFSSYMIDYKIDPSISELFKLELQQMNIEKDLKKVQNSISIE